MSINQDVDQQPWYKQGWPWALISVPFLTVVACGITIYLAIVSDDGLVTGDYYKDGLTINESIDKGERAAQLALSAQVLILPELNQVQVAVPELQDIPELVLRLTHATHTRADQVVELPQSQGGVYKAELKLKGQGKWYVDLRPANSDEWRLRGQLVLPGSLSLSLTP